MCLCMFVFVCVCVYVRESVREGSVCECSTSVGECVLQHCVCVCVCLCVCVCVFVRYAFGTAFVTRKCVTQLHANSHSTT